MLDQLYQYRAISSIRDSVTYVSAADPSAPPDAVLLFLNGGDSNK